MLVWLAGKIPNRIELKGKGFLVFGCILEFERLQIGDGVRVRASSEQRNEIRHPNCNWKWK